MKVMSHTIRFASACLLLALGACGGGGDGGAGTGTSSAGVVIGAAGGTVVGPNGATVVVPPGALASDTTIAIEQTSAGSPPLPGGVIAFGPMFALTPHGITFAVPVTLTVPFDPASVPAGATPTLYKTNAGMSGFDVVPGATVDGASMTAQVTSFSIEVVGSEPPLEQIEKPQRFWEFRAFPGDSTNSVPVSILFSKQDGVVDGPDARHEYGSTFFPTPRGDFVALGKVFSTANGRTYTVLAENPKGSISRGDSHIGSFVRLEQLHSYRKNAPDATLKLVVTAVNLDGFDFNPNEILPFDCVGKPDCQLEMYGRVNFTVHAYSARTTKLNVFAKGEVELRNVSSVAQPNASRWQLRTNNSGPSALWNVGNFVLDDDVDGNGGIHGRVKLKQPLTIDIDISKLDPEIDAEKEFSVRVTVDVKTFNQVQGESFISAYFRDPVNEGGATIETTGLTPTNNPLPPPPTDDIGQAPVCATGVNPAAGVLQFGAAQFATLELPEARQTIVVTRTGGSSGAVSATFTTGNGTASAGTDYAAVTRTVAFADGDVEPRTVEVPILVDTIAESDKTVNLSLSDVRGCASLGAQTTAVLNILDNDRPPVLPPSGLDLSFGTAGMATLERFGGDRSGMALQADGKIVMVGGTFADFILARFNADGSIDRSFGIDGKVTTDMGSGLRQEEALAVAIQSDGKIVVAGHTAIDATPPARDPSPTFALARYNSDGSLDTTFGSGGKVSDNVNGQAYAVAIQGDGKIVVAGEFSFDSINGSDFSDFTVARFNPNGTLDLAFGGSGTGQVATDIGSATNSARNLVLQPNGAIVVSGKPQGDQAGFDHTDVARYNANGTLDSSFGSGGKLTLAGVDVGQGLARQPDGKFVLAGSVAVGSSTRFALMRLNADGSTDSSFGSAGTVSTAFAVNAAATGVALQGDGKIVAVGTTVLAVNPNFVVARYNADGSTDTGFGSDGNLSIDFFGFTDIGESVLVQPDGKIVVGGQARNNFDGYGLARINP